MTQFERGGAPHPAVAPSLPAATVAQLDSLIQKAIQDKNLPGVMVGVWIPGQGEYQVAFGIADLHTGQARQVTDPFRIASITKTFTATAILQLADQGLLSTHDPLSKWFPDFPHTDRITVQDLLMMRSGVAEFADEGVLGAYYQRPLETFTAQDALRLAAARAASFIPPQYKTVYTNTNYVLLERIVERVSGQDINSYLQAHVMGPLDLRHTFYATDPVLPGPLHGYSLDATTQNLQGHDVAQPASRGWRRRRGINPGRPAPLHAGPVRRHTAPTSHPSRAADRGAVERAPPPSYSTARGCCT